MSGNPYQDPAFYYVSTVPIYGCPMPQLPEFSNEPHECEPITVETIKDDYARITAEGDPQFARNAIEMANAMRYTVNRLQLETIPTMYDPVAHDTEKPGPLEQPAECTDDHAEYDSRRFEEELDVQLGNIREMLIEKNRQYGDSALNPVRVFSKASPREQLLVRIDDKISRLARGQHAGEDTVNDLIGYLVMLRILDARMTK